MNRQTVAGLIAVGMITIACGTTPATETTPETTPEATTATTTPEEPVTLTLLAHDSFVSGVTEETFAAFTAETGVEVEVLGGGDAGAMLSQAILTKDNPVADVIFGVDDTFLSRALGEGIFQPYQSGLLSEVDPVFQLDPEGRVTPIDYGDVCLNYDLAVYGDRPDRPYNLESLLDPAHADSLVVEDPATSSTGLAFLLATVAAFGEDGWQDYWKGLVENGVKVVPDWDTAYYVDFTRYGGDRPIVVSYASSPVAEVIFADPPVDEAPTASADEGCYRQIEFAGVVAGTEHADQAGLLIDFLLSPAFQETIPTTWFVYPVNGALPEVFVEHSVVPAAPLSVDPESIDANREKWIEEWTEIVLP